MASAYGFSWAVIRWYRLIGRGRAALFFQDVHLQRQLSHQVLELMTLPFQGLHFRLGAIPGAICLQARPSPPP